MSLSAGTRLGPYEIVALLGAGAMGEVYRARDTRLKREVAIKVLPEGFSHDPDRLARFQREAELLATLNHPNIAAISGLEHSDGMTAIRRTDIWALCCVLFEMLGQLGSFLRRNNVMPGWFHSTCGLFFPRSCSPFSLRTELTSCAETEILVVVALRARAIIRCVNVGLPNVVPAAQQPVAADGDG